MHNSNQKMTKNTILKRKITEAKISQRELARRLNRHFQHVNYVVNGVRKSQRLSLEILAICNERINLLRGQ